MKYIILALSILSIYLVILIRRRNQHYDLKLRLGLKFIYPGFKRFIVAGYYPFFNFKDKSHIKVKDTIEFLEYKFPIYSEFLYHKFHIYSSQSNIHGYYHFGLCHSKKPYVYCYCTNSNGLIIDGGKEKLYDKSKTDEVGYIVIFRRLISEMEKTTEFQENFLQ